MHSFSSSSSQLLEAFYIVLEFERNCVGQNWNVVFVIWDHSLDETKALAAIYSQSFVCEYAFAQTYEQSLWNFSRQKMCKHWLALLNGHTIWPEQINEVNNEQQSQLQ